MKLLVQIRRRACKREAGRRAVKPTLEATIAALKTENAQLKTALAARGFEGRAAGVEGDRPADERHHVA
jgi:hypothetical protein